MNSDQIVRAGRGHEIVVNDEAIWRGHVDAIDMTERLAFMTPGHHRLRNFSVRELPRTGGRLAIDQVARALGLTADAALAIAAELERRLFFLVRRGEDEIEWAFPVTAAATPHTVRFSTGESTYGA